MRPRIPTTDERIPMIHHLHNSCYCTILDSLDARLDHHAPVELHCGLVLLGHLHPAEGQQGGVGWGGGGVRGGVGGGVGDG